MPPSWPATLAPPIGSAGAFAAAYAVKATAEPVGGYWAFVAPAVDGLSLHELLTTQKRDPDFTRVIRSVIRDVIAPGLERHDILEDDGSDDWTELRPRFAAEVEASLREISAASKGLRWNAENEVRRISSFLTPAVRSRWSASRAGALVSFLHGDLHTRNILVKKNSDVICIDFARAYLLPRLFDVATLFIDLALRCAASETELWSIAKARSDVAQLLSLRPFGDADWSTVTARFGNAGTLITALGEEISNTVPDVSRAELRDSLLHQLLRFIRFSTVPMPRRIMAVVLADSLLIQTQLVR